jgi:hypothetical protein
LRSQGGRIEKKARRDIEEDLYFFLFGWMIGWLGLDVCEAGEVYPCVQRWYMYV